MDLVARKVLVPSEVDCEGFDYIGVQVFYLLCKELEHNFVQMLWQHSA